MFARPLRRERLRLISRSCPGNTVARRALRGGLKAVAAEMRCRNGGGRRPQPTIAALVTLVLVLAAGAGATERARRRRRRWRRRILTPAKPRSRSRSSNSTTASPPRFDAHDLPPHGALRRRPAVSSTTRAGSSTCRPAVASRASSRRTTASVASCVRVYPVRPRCHGARRAPLLPPGQRPRPGRSSSVHVWRHDDAEWKLARVVSYGH